MTERSRQLFFAIATSVALVVTGAATAFAAGVPGTQFHGVIGAQAFGGGALGISSIAGMPMLRVSGTPVRSETAGFRTGHKIAWQVTPAGLGLDPAGLSFIAGNKNVWVVNGYSATTQNSAGGSRYLIGLDVGTGSVKWRLRIGAFEDHQLSCAPELLRGAAVCAFGTWQGRALSDPLLELIDVRTGQLTQQTTFSKLGLESAYAPDLHVFGASVIVRGAIGGVDGTDASHGSVSRIEGDLSAVIWKTPIQYCNGGEGWPAIARQNGDLLVLSDAQASSAFEFATGKILANPQCGTLDIFGQDGIVAGVNGYDHLPDSTTALANGHVATLVSSGDIDSPLSLVNFSRSERPSPLPIFYSSDYGGSAAAPVTAQALDPKTKASAWKLGVSGTYMGMRSGFYGAYDGTHLVLVDPAGDVKSVDPMTGATIWASSYPAPARGETEAGATEPRPIFATDGTLLVTDYDSDEGGSGRPLIAAFDPDTGVKLWEINDTTLLAPPSYSGGNALAVSAHGGVEGNVAALLPATTASDSASEINTSLWPQGLPACPSGMKPVSWATYPDGHILVCSGSGGFTADYVRKGQTIVCSALAFSGPRFTLSCAHNETVIVSGGSTLLQITTASASWLQPASRAWSSSATGVSVGFGAAATSIAQTCPAGSTPISLSYWRDGWLLICGTDGLHATSFSYVDPNGKGAGTAMDYTDGRYCGTTDTGLAVCANASPALVTITPKGGTSTRRSVTANYFVVNGSGGSGKGTGAYDVAAPKDTASDQVRYLVQILEKSQTGRSKVAEVLPALLKCSVNSDQVAIALSIVTNRQELVTALQSTPFDRIPGGVQLISELSNALHVSLQADQEYLTVTRQMVAGDCATGRSTLNGAIAIADTTDALKQTFVDDWNANIAGRFAGAVVLSSDKI